MLRGIIYFVTTPITEMSSKWLMFFYQAKQNLLIIINFFPIQFEIKI